MFINVYVLYLYLFEDMRKEICRSCKIWSVFNACSWIASNLLLSRRNLTIKMTDIFIHFIAVHINIIFGFVVVDLTTEENFYLAPRQARTPSPIQRTHNEVDPRRKRWEVIGQPSVLHFLPGGNGCEILSM